MSSEDRQVLLPTYVLHFDPNMSKDSPNLDIKCDECYQIKHLCYPDGTCLSYITFYCCDNNVYMSDLDPRPVDVNDERADDDGMVNVYLMQQ